jgi:hypothetical protein
MVIGTYFIGGYYCPLMVIILMAIGDYPMQDPPIPHTILTNHAPCPLTPPTNPKPFM